MKNPLFNEVSHDWATSVDDVDHWYNPDKYTSSGARVQVKSISQQNVTANITANSSANATQYDKPINSERAEPWETSTHDIVYYRPNKYYSQVNSTANVTSNATLAQKNITANVTSNTTGNAT